MHKATHNMDKQIHLKITLKGKH